jgi:hypothetical protein
MGIRRTFGPRITGTYARPESSEGKFDPSPTLSYKAHRKAAKGKIHVDLSFTIPAYDPTQHNQLVAVHTVAYPPDQTIPTSPDEVVTSSNPKTKADSIPTDGTELVLTVPHVPIGPVSFVTVLEWNDDETEDVPAPTQPTADAPVSDPTQPTADAPVSDPITASPAVATEPASATDETSPVAVSDAAPAPVDTPAETDETAPVEAAQVVDAAPAPTDPASVAPAPADPASPALAEPVPSAPSTS